MDGLHDIEVAVFPGGATVVVDGTPVGPVQAVTIQAAQGQVPQVLVQLAATSTIHVDGLIDIEAGPQTAGDLVRSIDPDELRRLDADDRSFRSMSMDPYEATLRIVAALLDQLTDTER